MIHNADTVNACFRLVIDDFLSLFKGCTIISVELSETQSRGKVSFYIKYKTHEDWTRGTVLSIPVPSVKGSPQEEPPSLEVEGLPPADSDSDIIIEALIAKYFNQFTLSDFPTYDNKNEDTWGAYRKRTTILVDLESFAFTLEDLYNEHYGDNTLDYSDFKRFPDTSVLYGPYGKDDKKFKVSFWI